MIVVIIICLVIQCAFYLLIFSRLALYNIVGKRAQSKKTSIVVCYRNEENNIERTLPYILEQDSDEVILVNDCSSDQSLEIMNKYVSDQVKVISNTQNSKGKKQALLSGIKASKNNSILLTDADCIPVSKKWSLIMSSYEKTFVLGYGPMEKVSSFVGLFSRFETYMTALQYLSYARIGIPYMGVGRNIKIDKAIILAQTDKIKGAHLASGDDDLMINALSSKENTSICIEPESFVYSKPKTTLNAFLNQKTRHISTAPFYKPIHKFLLSAFSGSHILFFIVLIISMITGTIAIKMGFVILMLKWTIQQMINYRVMKKLKEEDLFWKFPVLDILFFFYLLIMPFYYLFNKNNSSWS
jgi:glycosyltransferase involved in cell wall biosynthesis